MTYNFEISKAKRELIWAKIALMSPSGGGKTYTALRLATGMLAKLKELGLEKNGKILFGNTEASRGRYYANEFDYDIVDLGAPHEPEMYESFILYAVKNNYPIMIIDSASHEWEGRGGCLELHALAGGTYQSWKKVTPRHDKFIEALADSPIHIIATMRGKDAYELQKDENNKITVKKLGVGAKQREGFEYEFTVTFLLDQKMNYATTQKDNTHLFEDRGDFLLTEEDGADIVTWANSGEGYQVPVRNRRTIEVETEDLQNKIIEKCKALGGSKNDALIETLKKYDSSANPKRIKNIEKLTELLSELEKIKPVKKSKEKEEKELENA